ncbi:MAG: alanine--tRNA ligase [Actinobacteria bacterium 13_1_20CM_2_65_11]|nr:MAG: alanine--tRNA ligase [Chloroflexi bacterium 13_1_40CM_65_17]OLC64390.1 MAG: alanine--tRNA ligase [Actinobacteria bacterium 13_1_40CM_4_65_12]OLD24432.1 MAG: alanine--tRNA ligase [Chloroflexi bacterium 13_1_40CM_3_65_12]OLE80440.1 MAG: alanine--tRNA ligase [Actinobacteria bacterium 13_1_20CM_2_65_11]
MTGNEIRTRFLEHFASREHLVLPSAPLVPQGDPSTLFISAGMQPLKPYYLGLSQPPAPRLASCQKCLRTGDIDEVGKTDRHHTFFEMLGNFAPTGDYFKETAIPLAWELVTQRFSMPVDRLRVTIHPSDDQAHEIWMREPGMSAKHITRLEDNWWGLGEGPCGPDSEIWWDRGRDAGCGQEDCVPDHCDRFTEFWNLVFPQYDQRGPIAGTSGEAVRRGLEDGSLVPLKRPAIDTGMGLERISYILQGKTNVFETDLFEPVINRIRGLSGKQSEFSERIVADHVRAACFVMLDGVTPSNEGRGYVLRRLIRRATLHAERLAMRSDVGQLVDDVVTVMSVPYPELIGQKDRIQAGINQEAARFQRTLNAGMERFERIVARHPKVISGADAFLLHDTFGFPIDLTRELAAERGLQVDEEGFRAAMAAQKQRSRREVPKGWLTVKEFPKSEFTGYGELATQTSILAIRKDGQPADRAAEGEEVEVFLERTPFYAESGGQIGDTGTISTESGRMRVEDTQKPADDVIAHLGSVVTGELRVGEPATAAVDAGRRRQIARHHSATHLLHKALRETLGDHVQQKGSWVGPDHTTFDIPLNRAVTDDELKRINRRMEDKIREALPFHESHKPYKEAVAEGAMHLFDEKYGDVVRVVCFGDWTCELCGGTHVANTADIGPAVIVSESSIGSGLRRIDMVVGEAADGLIWRERKLLAELARSFNAAPDQLPERLESLRSQLKEAERRLKTLAEQLRTARVKGQGGNGLAVKSGKVPFVTETVEASSEEELAAYADRYLEMVKSGVVTVVAGDKFVIKVSKDLTPEYDAARLAALLGKGGGRPQLARGTLTMPAAEAFQRLEEALGAGAK